MLQRLYDLVMDPDSNPLRGLPKTVRFQVMVLLAYMWSVVFCVYIGMLALIGPSILVHTVLLLGVFFTADIFRRARLGELDTVRLANVGLILSGNYMSMRLREMMPR
jgi:hypothetical protein